MLLAAKTKLPGASLATEKSCWLPKKIPVANWLLKKNVPIEPWVAVASTAMVWLIAQREARPLTKVAGERIQ